MQEKKQGSAALFVFSLLAFVTLFTLFILTEDHVKRVVYSIALAISSMLVIAAGIIERVRSRQSRQIKL